MIQTPMPKKYKKKLFENSAKSQKAKARHGKEWKGKKSPFGYKHVLGTKKNACDVPSLLRCLRAEGQAKQCADQEHGQKHRQDNITAGESVGCRQRYRRQSAAVHYNQ